MSATYQERIRNVLGTSAAFKTLPEDLLEHLVEIATWREFDIDDLIIRMGEQGDSLFVVAQGRARVEVETSDGEIKVAAIGPGEYFGEVAVLWQEKRTANVRADGLMSAVELPGQPLRDLLEQAPTIRGHMTELSMDRLWETIDTCMEHETQ